MSKIIDGRKWAKIHQQKLILELKKLAKKPKIVSILVGSDPSSVLYSQIKQKKAKEVGIDFEWISFPETADFEDVAMEIENLNQNSTVNGIMVQLPMPDTFLKNHQEKELLLTIDPDKDVDGLTGLGDCLPAAVAAVLALLKDEAIKVKDKNVVVIGKSNLVGKPIADQLKLLGAKVEVCDSKTEDLKQCTLTADILVSATGVPYLVSGKMIRDGTVLIDIGASKVNGKLLGDVDFESVYPKVSKITPVPGGVGPMTVICLMENVVRTCLVRAS